MAKLPSIIIGGFQKCGTTALFEILRRHPEIDTAVNLPENKVPPGPKELHFFNEDKQFTKGLGWYASYFGDGPNPAIDATPEYTVWKKTIRRLGQSLPNAKIILLMRDPVERVISAWNHLSQLPKNEKWPLLVPDGDLIANARAEIHRLIAPPEGAPLEGGYYRLIGRGFYILPITYLDTFYPRDQVYLGFSHELRNDHENEIRKIQEFLGIDTLPLDGFVAHARNYGAPAITSRGRIFLEEIFTPFDDRLEERVGRPLPWRVSEK